MKNIAKYFTMLIKRINKLLLLLIILTSCPEAQNSDNIYAAVGFPELFGIGIEKSNFKFSVGTLPWTQAVINEKPYSFVFTFNKNIIQQNKLSLRIALLSSYIYGIRIAQTPFSGGLKYRNDAIAIGPRIVIGSNYKKVFGEIGTGLNLYFENTFYSNGTSDRFEISNWGIYSICLNIGYKY